MRKQWDPIGVADETLVRQWRPGPGAWLTGRRVLWGLGLWAVLTLLGVFHVHLRFLARDIQLERQLLVRKQEELVKRQFQLESQLAVVHTELAQEMERVQAALGLVEIDPRARTEAEIPRELVARYLPAAPVRATARQSSFLSAAQAGQVEMSEIVQALVTVFEANRAEGHPQENPQSPKR